MFRLRAVTTRNGCGFCVPSRFITRAGSTSAGQAVASRWRPGDAAGRGLCRTYSARGRPGRINARRPADCYWCARNVTFNLAATHRWCRCRGRGDAANGRAPKEAGRRIFWSGIHCSAMTGHPELRTRVIVDQWVDPLIRADEWVIPETWPMLSSPATGQRALGRSANRDGYRDSANAPELGSTDRALSAGTLCWLQGARAPCAPRFPLRPRNLVRARSLADAMSYRYDCE